MWAVPEVENMPGGSTNSEEDKLKMVSEGCNTSTVSFLHLNGNNTFPSCLFCVFVRIFFYYFSIIKSLLC